MAGTYAADTTVPVNRSRDEIERTLRRFGAEGFGYAWDGAENRYTISFRIKGYDVVMGMILPRLEHIREHEPYTLNGRRRSESAIERDWDQRCRQRWRSLANGVKAKLALIDDGISTVEREFLADIVVGDETVGAQIIPGLAAAVREGALAAALNDGPKVIALPSRTG